MWTRLTRLTLNQRLAVLAIVLGAGALFATPQPGHAVRIAPRDLAVMVEREVDHVTPRELAEWIISGRADFRVIDLRSEAEYAAYHIPGASRVPISALPDQRFLPTERIVLYSDGGIHSAQAWFLLKARGARNAYILLGGLEAWRDEVLFPRLDPEPATPFQRERNEKLKALAAHFGGRALEAGGEAAAPPVPTLPKVDVPTAPAAPMTASPPRKRREGC